MAAARALFSQDHSAISWEFIPDVIIAGKLQSTTNNYDGLWQVERVHLPINTSARARTDRYAFNVLNQGGGAGH